MKPIFLAFLLVIWIAKSAPAVSVVVNGMGAPQAVRALENSDGLHLSVTDFAACFSAACVFSPEKRKLVVHFTRCDAVFTEGNPFVKVCDSVVNLPYAPFLENGEFFVCAGALVLIFDDVLLEKLSFSADKKTIEVAKTGLPAAPDTVAAAEQKPSPPLNSSTTDSSRSGEISRATCEERKNGTLYTLFLPDSMAFDFTFFKPQLNINIFKGRISASDLNQKRTSGLLREVEAVQFADNAQLSLIVSDKVKDPEVRYLSGPPRIEVVFRQDNPIRPPDSAAAAKAPPAQKICKIKTVIIDPGHGGKDPGAISDKPRLDEKDVVLAIGKKLAELIKKTAPEIQCVLIRDNDTFVTLKDRSVIANQKKGSLFISIHANSVKGGRGKKPVAGGYAVYFLDAARDDEARAVAALENSALDYEDNQKEAGLSDLDFILKSSELNIYRNESEDFAIILEKELGNSVKDVKRNKTGVSQAGFYVLRGPEMPAVLLETAFISNSREAELLSEGGFQQEVAEAICRSVVRFKEKYERALQ